MALSVADVIAKLVQERDAARANLTAVQERCSSLLEDARTARRTTDLAVVCSRAVVADAGKMRAALEEIVQSPERAAELAMRVLVEVSS